MLLVIADWVTCFHMKNALTGMKPTKVTRRRFFKNLVGEFIFQYDEARGKQHIPLGRIKDLPEHVIREIRPVFFHGPEWRIIDNGLFRHNPEGNGYTLFRKFNENESFIIQHFEKDFTLDGISKMLSGIADIEATEAFHQVSGLFFDLVSHMVCHPLEQYDFDAILEHET